MNALVLPRWLLWALLALLSWGVWAILSKLMGNALSAAHSQALSTVGLLPVMLALAVSRSFSVAGSRRRGMLLALAAGVLTCLGNAAYYDVLNRGAKAATVVPLTAMYPLVTVVLAVVLLKEKLNRIQAAGIVLSLAAIYLFNVQREAGFFSGALAYALVPVALWGVAGLLQKLSTNHISGELAALAFLGAFVPVAALILWLEPLPAIVAAKTWLLVVALGLFFALGNFALLTAFAHDGKASIITPVAGLYPVVSVPIAILFLSEKVGGREGAGIALALVSVVALARESPAGPSAVANLKSETHA